MSESASPRDETAPDLVRAADQLARYADEVALILAEVGYPAKAESLAARISNVRAALRARAA